MTANALLGTRPESAVANIRARRGGDLRTAQDGRKLAVIFEGGAMRGVFSGGCGAALESLALTDAFDEVYGCSAGAINAAYFLAGQAADAATIYSEEINNNRFINLLRFHKILDLDFLFDDIIAGRRRLDVERVLDSPSRFLISIADARTGAGFLVDGRSRREPLLDYLRASATHPLLCSPMQSVGGQYWFDGGFANPLPISEAIDNGCTDILVLLTRQRTYVHRQPSFLLREWFRLKCARGNTALVRAGLATYRLENASRDLALGRRAAPPHVNIVTVCPHESAAFVGWTTRKAAALKASANDGAEQVRRLLG